MLQRMEQPVYGAEGLCGAREESEAGKWRERGGKIRGWGSTPEGRLGSAGDSGETWQSSWSGAGGASTAQVWRRMKSVLCLPGSRPHQSTSFKNGFLHAALGVMLTLEAFKKSYSLQIIYNHTHLLERLNPFFKK